MRDFDRPEKRVQPALRRFLLLAVAFALLAPPPSHAAQARGDANADNAVTVADVTYLVNFLFAGGPAPLRSCLADVDASQGIDALDVFYLVNFLFGGGPAPPSQPFETCNGRDDDCDGQVDQGLSGCFSVPFGQPPAPAQEDSGYATQIRRLDGYILLDRSGSMTGENAAIKSGFLSVASSVTCPPLGTGTPGQCFEDPWWGFGTIGYQGMGGSSYVNHLDLQPNANPSTVLITEPTSGCCNEATHQALYSTATGAGSSSLLGCTVSSYAARTTCTTSPAANAGFATTGYPCFRTSALRVAFVFTDEAPSANNACPSAATLITIAQSAGLRIVGLMGDGSTVTLQNELRTLATGTGTVDSSNAPLVFSASGSSAPAGLQNALLTIASGFPLDISAAVQDTAGDAVDTVAAFVRRIETFAPGTPQCSNAFAMADGNGDGFPETYQSAVTGTPLCWRLVLKQNGSVPPAAQPQIFPATIRILGQGEQVLDERAIAFIVPSQ